MQFWEKFGKIIDFCPHLYGLAPHSPPVWETLDPQLPVIYCFLPRSHKRRQCSKYFRKTYCMRSKFEVSRNRSIAFSTTFRFVNKLKLLLWGKTFQVLNRTNYNSCNTEETCCVQIDVYQELIQQITSNSAHVLLAIRNTQEDGALYLWMSEQSETGASDVSTTRDIAPMRHATKLFTFTLLEMKPWAEPVRKSIPSMFWVLCLCSLSWV